VLGPFNELRCSKADYRGGILARENRVAEQTSHYFGKFQSQAEAEQWIADHRWTTTQRQEPDADLPDVVEEL
jgi:hypothetical protein